MQDEARQGIDALGGVAAGGLGVVGSGVLVLGWLQTPSVWLLVAAVLAAVLVPAAVWVLQDARSEGLPRVPWALLTLLLPLLGWALDLLVREIRASGSTARRARG